MEDVEPHGPFNKILKFSSGVQAGEMRNVINSTLLTVLHAKSTEGSDSKRPENRRWILRFNRQIQRRHF